MATFDIRFSEEAEIDKILFADETEDEITACSLQKSCLRSDISLGKVGICAVNDYHYSAIALNSEQHALHLIEALKKAIDLGWWREKKRK